MHKHTTSRLALGSLLAGGLALSGSAFAMNELAAGYLQSTTNTGAAAKAAKSAEGSCGAARMDTDGDGAISKAEFTARHAGKEDKFASIDTDGNGSLSKAEMDAHHAAGGKDKKMEGKCGEGKCGGH